MAKQIQGSDSNSIRDAPRTGGFDPARDYSAGGESEDLLYDSNGAASAAGESGVPTVGDPADPQG